MKTTSLFFSLLISAMAFCNQPNVVFIITDDQGYGDLGCTGNPVIKTPNMDALHGESTSFSDYHVAPTCSPTRSALLTGHWTNRTGVWHTINGRSMLRENEVTIGQLFKDAGYQTGMFGKWHLGDNFPYRPEDRGFTEVYRHGGGGVGQTPDVWDNAYFDGSYFHNGNIEPANGFCTDVFFEQGRRFIRNCVEQQKPFLAYIALNAPHGPLHAPQKYMDMYVDQDKDIAAFYGMITNIDENVGRTRDLIKELGIENNTIFIFTTDNGTATGEKVYNAGMRGKKGSPYDGGHRVPFFIRWPAGNLTKQQDMKRLCHAVDIVPTLLDLCQIEKPTSLKFDGVSLKSLLEDSNAVWPDRFLITDSQRVTDPIIWRQSSVMSERWRLINGEELYDIKKDSGQQNNVAKDHPQQVGQMREFYEKWWAELEPTFAMTTELHLGHADHPVVSLTAHDWIGARSTPWNQAQIRNGMVRRNNLGNNSNTTLKYKGHWAVKVIADGEYEISVRRWPKEADRPITGGLLAGSNVPGATRAFRARPGNAIQATTATLRIDEKDVATLPVSDDSATQITFKTRLKKGSHKLAPVFHTDQGEVGAYYAIATKVD